jgi:mono/diheme cytochrome c family protein
MTEEHHPNWRNHVMKALSIFLGIVAFILLANATFGQAEIQQSPLTWQQAALNDGEELFAELCAACHGASGMGDGPAAGELEKTVPDLTGLAANNDGTFPFQQVEEAIAGDSRTVSHGTVDMPNWSQAFEDLRPDWKAYRRKAFAKQRVYNLTEYVASIQAETTALEM